MSVFCTPFKPLCKKKEKGALHLYSKRAPTPPSLCSLLSLSLSLLCTLKAQVEAGVSQLNIYTFLAFILLHTYLTSMNGALLTPFNSHSKQVLLAQLMCNNSLCDVSPPRCISSLKETLLTPPNCSDGA